MFNKALLVSLLVIAAGLPGASLVRAEEVPEDVARAIETMANTASTAWHYTRTGDNGDQIRVERYTHGAEDPWELLSVDGIPATEGQRAAYSKKRDERDDRDHPGNVDVLTMIEISSLRRTEESEQHTDYSFQPAPDENTDAKFAEALAGTLRIDRELGTLQWLQMASREPFAPRIGVKIERMLMRLEFTPPEATRPGFIVAIRNDVDAKIAGMKSMEQRQSVRFHDFEPAE